jgi:hypothetical protein
MDKHKATEILLAKIAEWEAKPKIDGYEYEKSFIEVMRGLNEYCGETEPPVAEQTEPLRRDIIW